MQEQVDSRVVTLEACTRLLTSVAKRQQTLLEELKMGQERQDAMLQEVRRDAKQTQRLWVRLAQRHGWLEDADFP